MTNLLHKASVALIVLIFGGCGSPPRDDATGLRPGGTATADKRAKEDFIKKMAPEVTEPISREAFLKQNRTARLITDNREEDFKEYLTGDNLFGSLYVFSRDKLIVRRLSRVCNNKEDAQRRLKEMDDRFGPPNSTIIPDIDNWMTVRHLWENEELGLSVVCGMAEGSLKTGAKTYYFVEMVTNTKLMKEQLK